MSPDLSSAPGEENWYCRIYYDSDGNEVARKCWGSEEELIAEWRVEEGMIASGIYVAGISAFWAGAGELPVAGVHKVGSVFAGKLRSPSASPTAIPGVLDDSANFAQKTYGEFFYESGPFAGLSVGDRAEMLLTGKISPEDVPVQNFTRKNGQTLLLNTRSSQALTRAETPRSDWYGENISGDASALTRLAMQLKKNKTPPEGFKKVRPKGLQNNCIK